MVSTCLVLTVLQVLLRQRYEIQSSVGRGDHLKTGFLGWVTEFEVLQLKVNEEKERELEMASWHSPGLIAIMILYLLCFTDDHHF